MWINGSGVTNLKNWGFYIVKNFMRMMLLLIAVSIVTFALVSISPIDPLQANVGQAALGSMSQEQKEKMESYWGVHEPPVERYLNWAKDFLQGDMGVSLLYRQPVSSVIAVKLGNSLILMLIAWLISGALGFFLGVLSGVYRGGWIDKLVRGYCLLIASTPVFWLALILLLVFAVYLKILPIGLSVPIGMEASGVTIADRLQHAILPAMTLSITGVSNIALHTREKMIDVMESDYVLFARARGEKLGAIVVWHGLRNIIIPAITLQFASISEIIGGSVLVEQVFSYPGLGQAAVAAGTGSDVPLLLGITLATAAIVFMGNYVANLLYGAVDPRMRKRGKVT
ncbi:MAG TPA: ABC transporter permease [Candidatus Pelethocola excrementipullorum]|nr:ABC transporter permease [Candidatus Pelethocola excrementipullorum]